MNGRVLSLASIGFALIVASASAQFRFFRGPEPPLPPNPAYDGRFTFARLKFTSLPGGGYRNGYPPWGHEYPTAEQNLVLIMDAVTNLGPRLVETVVVKIDDPQLTRYPIAYMTEPGFWDMTDSEALALRAYFRKGGFVIFDDFRGSRDWQIFTDNMERVLPGARFVNLTQAEQVFHSFFEILSIDNLPQYHDRGRPMLRGVFEDNDPRKRLMAMVNFNTDIADYWEYAATGFKPIEESNEGYKLGVNYVIYGMTH
jgi:hypothetical protein